MSRFTYLMMIADAIILGMNPPSSPRMSWCIQRRHVESRDAAVSGEFSLVNLVIQDLLW
ncbi:MAG TPA: hypothetical protein VED17_08640 [Nitrososphaerales archaeon]|nr:hypothetical protein [Nitrososphaerales archaeon]